MATRANPVERRRLAEVAVRYAEYGWPVLPLHTPRGEGCSCRWNGCASPGKHPRTSRGLHQATTDIEQVQAWWDRWPQANIGVATGIASGLLVLDVDLPAGPDSLARLEADHGPLPTTCEQRTGSGGRQLLFVHPDVEIGNRASVVPGVDVRGDGGYVVVPPSLHACGDRYAWVARTPPTSVPSWLVGLLDRRQEQARANVRHPVVLTVGEGSRQQRYAAAALRAELAGLSAAVEGTRNATLNRAAFSLGQLVAVGLLDHDHVTAELERVAQDIGLGPREAHRTIASGLTAGLNQPRAISDRRPLQGAGTDTRSLTSPVRRIGARRR